MSVPTTTTDALEVIPDMEATLEYLDFDDEVTAAIRRYCDRASPYVRREMAAIDAEIEAAGGVEAWREAQRAREEEEFQRQRYVNKGKGPTTAQIAYEWDLLEYYAREKGPAAVVEHLRARMTYPPAADQLSLSALLVGAEYIAFPSEFLLEVFDYAEAHQDRDDLLEIREIGRFFRCVEKNERDIRWATSEEYQTRAADSDVGRELGLFPFDQYHVVEGSHNLIELFGPAVGDVLGGLSYLVRIPEDEPNIAIKPASRARPFCQDMKRGNVEAAIATSLAGHKRDAEEEHEEGVPTKKGKEEEEEEEEEDPLEHHHRLQDLTSSLWF
jgi:hypothetical protein